MDDFFVCCQKLEQAGITPVGLHTAGTAWAPMLFATAYLGTSTYGQEFMHRRLPQDYNGRAGQDLVNILEKLYEYTNADGIYQDFDVPYHQFANEEIAMLPNGFWMLLQFVDDKAETVGFAPFSGKCNDSVPRSLPDGASYPAIRRRYRRRRCVFKFRTLQTQEQAEIFYMKSQRISRHWKGNILLL
ncbi:hypothetical protein C823_007922 [Eubacterium plexicaudatum ASF492]|nr:hypothetical protein C823_007922 [Eubacterium plexicaudatum ASF492]